VLDGKDKRFKAQFKEIV
jgi:Synaptobrevin